MAYSSTNPPQLLVPGMGTAPQLWHYRSTDSTTVAIGSGYFANGHALGMRVDDVILISVASTNAFAIGKINAVTASSAATAVVGTLTSTT